VSESDNWYKIPRNGKKINIALNTYRLNTQPSQELYILILIAIDNLQTPPRAQQDTQERRLLTLHQIIRAAPRRRQSTIRRIRARPIQPSGKGIRSRGELLVATNRPSGSATGTGIAAAGRTCGVEAAFTQR
jgi:hypothetical protein